MNQAEGVRQIVERARAGDQVAMALIDQTRKQSEKGNKHAQKSRKLIEAYIRKNPPSTMAGDSSLNASTNPAAQMAVWRTRGSGPEAFAQVIARASPFMGPWALICAILHGPKLSKGQPLMLAAATPKSRIAYCVRKAFRLQQIASDRRVPIASYCRLTACELGE